LRIPCGLEWPRCRNDVRESMNSVRFKIPRSVLVVIYTPQRQTLLLNRADHAGFWQSVTGSLSDPDEPLAQACAREVEEETGWRAAPGDFDDWGIENEYEIFVHWRYRYAPGVTHNRERVFGLCVDTRFEPRLAPREHIGYRWMNWKEAADACFSWSNVQAIRRLADLQDGRLVPRPRR
jgi:dihydroneopterin triphosphate diphosphatase